MRGIVGACALSLVHVVMLTAGTAHADGNGTLGLSILKRGPGVSIASSGVGLAGRRAGQPAQPVTSATISVSALPTGATIDHAYLYWVTYGSAGVPAMTFDGAALNGTLIGEHDGTCWHDRPTHRNFTYRVDVTARISGNGDHTLTGFPSETAAADTQGASLVVLYTDPNATTYGSVHLHDGALVMSDNNSATGTFEGVDPTAALTSARFQLGVGDGQSTLAEGALSINGYSITAPVGGHFSGSAGRYWDNRDYDVRSQLLAFRRSNIRWNLNFDQDCLAFAFVALTVQSPEFPDAGVGDAGEIDAGDEDDSGASSSGSQGGSSGAGASSSSGSTGPSGSSGATNTPGDGGADGSQGGGAGNAVDDAASGCGCTGADPQYTSSSLLVAVAAIASLRRRRKP